MTALYGVQHMLVKKHAARICFLDDVGTAKMTSRHRSLSECNFDAETEKYLAAFGQIFAGLGSASNRMKKITMNINLDFFLPDSKCK